MKPAAEVRPAEGLANLARRINAEHEAGEKTARKSLDHFRAAGDALIKAKEQCGHGKWLKWLKDNVTFSERKAQRYMEFARSDVTSDLEEQLEAWRKCSGNIPATPQTTASSDVFKDWIGIVRGQAHVIETQLGGIETLLADKNAWDWPYVRNIIIPELRDMASLMNRYLEEIENAANES